MQVSTPDFDAIGAPLRASLDAKNAAREQALPLCRASVRFSANAIRSVHRGDATQTVRLLGEARRCLDEALAAMEGQPEVRYAGFYHDAAKEYVEARLTQALVEGLALPTAADLGAEAPAYLNGMGEAVGEMRRHLLDLMRIGELGRCEDLLATMDEIYHLLMSMDYPEAITAGLRRTSDAIRAVIERTRGDLTTTLIQSRLQRVIESGLSTNGGPAG